MAVGRLEHPQLFDAAISLKAGPEIFGRRFKLQVPGFSRLGEHYG